MKKKKKEQKPNGSKGNSNTEVSTRQLDGWDGPSADIGPVTAGTGQYFPCNFFWFTRDQSLSRTQVQMGNRINRFVKVIKTNSENAATAFTEIIDALGFSTSNGTSCNGDTGSEALVLFKKLKNCPNTVPKICDVAAIPALTAEVKKELDVNDPASCLSQSASYGKAYKDCVLKFSMKDHLKVCPCLTDPATPQPPPRSNPACLPKFFDEASKEVTKRKKYCDIGNSESPDYREGSWGDCQKALQSAVQYVIGGTNNCMGDNILISMTTVAPGGRRLRLNQQFMKFAGMKQD